MRRSAAAGSKSSRGPGGPLPAWAQPAAHRAAPEDAPREAHRGAAAGGRRADPDHWVRRTLRNGRCQLDGRGVLARCGLRGAGSRRPVPAHGRFPAAATLWQLRAPERALGWV